MLEALKAEQLKPGERSFLFDHLLYPVGVQDLDSDLVEDLVSAAMEPGCKAELESVMDLSGSMKLPSSAG